MATVAIAEQPGWAARLELALEARGGRSVLARNAHAGPLRVQRPFYPEGDGVCHVVIVHPPGGVVGGDELAIDVAVGADAHGLVTTPAATKLYRSAGAHSVLRTRVAVAPGGVLEHLPQETIAFAGCRARAALTVELAAGARFVGWEITALGRPASGEAFTTGALHQRIAIARGGRPIFLEHARHEGGGERQGARWGLGGHAVVGTMIAVGARTPVDTIRAALSAYAAGAMVAATALDDDVMVARYLGDDPRAALAAFEAARAAIRPDLCGRPAVAPRIWAT